MPIDRALEFAKQNQNQHLELLREFIAIPTISTLPDHIQDMERGAKWLANHFSNIGLGNVEVAKTGGHPVVYGEWLNKPSALTVLVYGHYDVQPADPIDEWQSAPFEPTVRGDYIYGRGASDMKANGITVLAAMEAFMKGDGLPVNVKVLFEGEEETASHLEDYVKSNRSKLKCDVALVADGGIVGKNMPSLAYGCRGILYMEVHVTGPETDLHSGEFGGAVHNPAQVLSELIAGMHDMNGCVMLPHFYDKVRPLPAEERAELARDPFDDQAWRATTKVKQLYGEKGFTTTERVGARPTLEVNGLLSGFTGEGSKTVLPAKAMAKISMRLVPHQDPAAVQEGFMEYMRTNAPGTVTWEAKKLASSQAFLVNRDSRGVRAAAAALQESFGVKPIFRLEGGSLPILSALKSELNVEPVIMGFSLPDDGLHAPNEKFYLPHLQKGAEAYIRFFQALIRE